MTNVIFLTSGKIEYKFKDLDLYDSIRLTAQNIRFPSLTEEGLLDVKNKTEFFKSQNIDAIYTAPSAQCIETAEVISKELDLKIDISKNLLPLKFDLNDLLSKEQFYELGDKKFDVLRSKFINFFFNNKLDESNKEIKTRYNEFLLRLVDIHPNKNILIVSHAYLLRLLLIYHKHKDEMYKNENLLNKEFNAKEITMKRLEETIISFK